MLLDLAKAGGMKAIQNLVVRFEESTTMKWKKYVPGHLALACNEASRQKFLTDGGLHTLMGLGKTNSDSIQRQCANVLLSLA